jgi:hypothetical protein
MRNYVANRVAALAVAVLALTGLNAEAALITLSPSSQDASVSDVVSVDILVSGLTELEAVGSVSLFLSFDDSILAGLGYSLDPDSAMGNEVDFSFGFDGGIGSPLDLFFIADGGLDFAALKALQGTGFRLATVTFLAIGPGLTSLVLSENLDIFLGNAEGELEIPATAVDGDVCVDCDPAPVPEPSTFALLGAGALAVLARQVRRRAKK